MFVEMRGGLRPWQIGAHCGHDVQIMGTRSTSFTRKICADEHRGEEGPVLSHVGGSWQQRWELEIEMVTTPVGVGQFGGWPARWLDSREAGQLGSWAAV